MKEKSFWFGVMFLGLIITTVGCGTTGSVDTPPVKRIITATSSSGDINVGEKSNTTGNISAFNTCFENIGLKETTRVEMNLVKQVAVGVFTIDDNIGWVKAYPFTGSANNNKLKITFANNNIPEILQKSPSSLEWTINAEKGIEKLSMDIYGQDYETKKYSVYPIAFDSCSPTKPPQTTTAEPKNIVATLDDKEKTITLSKGDTVLLKFGNETFDWTITVENQKIIDRVKNVMVMSDAQGLYKALASGTTDFVVKGEPKCFKTAPQCALALVGFKIHILVK
jgi:hypothetical protein